MRLGVVAAEKVQECVVAAYEIRCSAKYEPESRDPVDKAR